MEISSGLHLYPKTINLPTIMRPLIFTLSKTFVGLFFLLLVQAAAGQVREDIFGNDHIATLEEHIHKKKCCSKRRMHCWR